LRVHKKEFEKKPNPQTAPFMSGTMLSKLAITQGWVGTATPVFAPAIPVNGVRPADRWVSTVPVGQPFYAAT
jgi:hypothetical protein